MTTAYPLQWPDGWPRTPEHERRAGREFKTGRTTYGENATSKQPITLAGARDKLLDALHVLGGKQPVLSSDVPIRKDGIPYSDGFRPSRGDDPGVAVYFQYKGRPMVMAADRYDNPAANTRSLGLAIEGMRQLERHGGGHMIERAFGGFTALPPPEGSKPRRPWWEVMGYKVDPVEAVGAGIKEIEARYKVKAIELHPDQGGSEEAMAELNQALEDVRALF